MRLALALALLSVDISVATAKPQPAATVGPDQPYQSQQEKMENKSRQSQEEQEIRNKRFDQNVKKATGSVCIGCFADPKSGSAKPERRGAAPKRDVDE